MGNRGGGAPLILFAIPDTEAEMNRFEVAIPNLGSLILTHDWNGRVLGLDAFAEEDRPPVWPVFWSFRIMVALGVLDGAGRDSGGGADGPAPDRRGALVPQAGAVVGTVRFSSPY